MLRIRYITIDNVKLAYTEQGKGQPVVMVHDFGTSSYTWTPLFDFLKVPRRYITLDLKGFGHSEKNDDVKYSTFHQARLLSGFINALKLKKVILIGHSFGGAVCLFSLLLEELKARVSGLILLNSMGYFQDLPEFIAKLRVPIITSETLVSLTQEMLSRDLISKGYFDLKKMTKARLDEYLSILAMPGAKLCLVKSARYINDNDADFMHFRFNQIRVPTMIIWGENDAILSVYDAHRFYEDIPHADLILVPNCGHFPQEECPEEAAGYISQFLERLDVRRKWFDLRSGNVKHDKLFFNVRDFKTWKEIANNNKIALMSRFRKLHMRRLIDRWTPAVFVLFIFVKILQVLKRLGVVAEENGWRTATRAYLRKEDSKFTLAVFRLDIWSDLLAHDPAAEKDTRSHVVERLAQFLKKVPSSHWRIIWSRFSARRARQGSIDIISVEFDEDANLRMIDPHLDSHSWPLKRLTPEIKKLIHEAFVRIYNETRDIKDKKRPWLLRKRLMVWLRKKKKFSIRAFLEARQYIERLLSGTFISFELVHGDVAEVKQRRFADPQFIKRKHPGFGLLNILCRVPASCDEVDLWFQFHHIPVDGAPMQEVLQSLKESWGLKGQLIFPALHKAHQPRSTICSTETGKQATYHISEFIDFRDFLALRTELNKQFAAQLLEGITAVSMLLWGLAHHEVFADRKFLFTVDLTDVDGERRPGVVFMRPGMFFDQKDPFAGFLKYQREFNRRLHATRARISESYELLELYALTSPVIYDLTRRLMPRGLNEFIGTVGVTMIKGADLFITPHSEIHTDGFLAFGNFTVPTEDGESAGAVSIRGPQDKIEHYLDAIRCVVKNFNDYL
jgi:pimeloyl-ACP methyl ester carboxylesterase